MCLGCLIRGETPHFDYIARAAADGITRVAIDTGVPVTFGVLTTNTAEEALARAGDGSDNKGREAAAAALEMARLYARLPERRPANAGATARAMAALQILYLWEIGRVTAATRRSGSTSGSATRRRRPTESKRAFARRPLSTAPSPTCRSPMLDQLIAAHSEELAARADGGDRPPGPATWRSGSCWHEPDTPAPVVIINEAIELARTFSGGGLGRIRQRRARCDTKRKERLNSAQ